ncbi:hypothetical protein IJ00_04025 [Calothrix sp. 336/3]|nr:hypothetical protein IJ00_04025 [Calothrix sp. 336/3]
MQFSSRYSKLSIAGLTSAKIVIATETQCREAIPRLWEIKLLRSSVPEMLPKCNNVMPWLLRKFYIIEYMNN